MAAYLLGSIPTGFLVARAKGIDIRTVGSGNIGATNAMRVLGKPAGIFVLLMDALKGYAACVCGFAVHFQLLTHIPDLPMPSRARDRDTFAIIAGIFAVLGHNYTCWLKFKGGKGIATSAGVYLALAPLALRHCAGGFHSGVAADALRFGRFHCGGGGVARGGLDSAAAQFIARHRHDGARRAGHLQTQEQHPTAHGRNRKPVRQKTSTTEATK